MTSRPSQLLFICNLETEALKTKPAFKERRKGSIQEHMLLSKLCMEDKNGRQIKLSLLHGAERANQEAEL